MKTTDAVRLLCGSCLAYGFMLQPALAQGTGAQAPAEEATGKLQEVVVTAQKREENLQETPIAISAITTEALEQRGIVDVSRLTALAPNVSTTVSPSSNSNSTIAIRGVGNGDPILTSDTPVSIYVDGIVIGRQAGAAFDLVDLERVEVLRGPQGTLYGRNTIGGAVNLITAKPADEFRLKEKLSYGSWNQWQTRTSIDSGQWGESGVRAKLSYLHKERDGYVDNLAASSDIDPGASKVDAARVALSFDRGSAFRADYAFDYNKIKGVPPLFQATAVNAGAARVLAASPALGGRASQVSAKRLDKVYLDEALLNDDEVTGHTLTLELDLGADTTLRSLTGYRGWDELTRSGEIDGQGGIRALTLDRRVLFPPPLFAVIPTGVQSISFFRPDTSTRRQHQVSQEFNLLGKIGERLDYVAGVFYFKENSYEWSRQFVTIPLPEQLVALLPPSLAAATVPQPPSEFQYTHESESKAIFGQATYDITDRLSFTGGVRYTEDKKDLDQTKQLSGAPPRQIRRDFSRFNWAATLDFKVNDDVMTYARAATGYKAGGMNARSVNNGYEPEEVTSFEVGAKSELFDKRLRLNAAAFYVDHKDMQLQQFVAGSRGATSNTVNAGQAEYMGLEVELEALLTDRLTLSGNFGYLDRDFKKFLLLNQRTNVIEDVSNNAKFTYSAKQTASAALQYDLPRFGIGQLSGRLEYNYRSKVYFQPMTGADYGTPLNEDMAGAGRSLVDARLTLSDVSLGGAKASFALWGRNLTDEEYRIHGIDFGPSLGYAGNVWGEPRSYGVDLTVSF